MVENIEKENFTIFTVGEEITNCILEADKKQTQPPSHYTEASLVKDLQAKEIGRPSTFSSIVETVLSQNRGYATLENKKIIPTDKGIQLANFLDRAFPDIININYTKELEEKLDLIANGKLDKLEFLNNFYNSLEHSIKNNEEINQEMPSSVLCPKCGAPMLVKRSRYGKLFYGCSKWPDCTGLISYK